MSRPLRVFVINAPEAMGGVTWWRMFRPLQLLHRTYDDIEITHNQTGYLFPHHFQYVDVVLCFRPSEPAHVEGFKMAVAAGVPIISDFDDDLLNIPIGNDAWYDFNAKRACITACVAMSAQVWVSTPALKETYGHPDTVVIPNAVLQQDMPDAMQEHSGAVAWRGMKFHREDLEIYSFRSDYASMLKKIRRFLWIGYMPTWAAMQGGAQIDFEPGMIDVRQWFAYLQSQRLQALLKPLMPCKFNDGKSNISWIEATIAGAVLITNYAGKPGWEYALEKMPRTEVDRADAWGKSRQEILENYNLVRWNEVRYRELKRIAYGTS